MTDQKNCPEGVPDTATEIENAIHDTVHVLRAASERLAPYIGHHPSAASLKKLLDQGLRFFAHVV